MTHAASQHIPWESGQARILRLARRPVQGSRSRQSEPAQAREARKWLCSAQSAKSGHSECSQTATERAATDGRPSEGSQAADFLLPPTSKSYISVSISRRHQPVSSIYVSISTPALRTDITRPTQANSFCTAAQLLSNPRFQGADSASQSRYTTVRQTNVFSTSSTFCLSSIQQQNGQRSQDPKDLLQGQALQEAHVSILSIYGWLNHNQEDSFLVTGEGQEKQARP